MEFGRVWGGFRPFLYMDGPRRPRQGTLHCASASRGGGRRNARRAGGCGTLPDMAALAAAGPRALGSMRRMPAKRFAASRSASLRLHGLYIDASQSNPRTLSAPLWRIGRLRGFRTESVSQAIATSHGGEGERIRRRTEGPARFPHSRYAFSSTASRTQRDIRLDTARLHGSEHRRLRSPFRLCAQNKGAGSTNPDSCFVHCIAATPLAQLPSRLPFPEHEKREAVQMEQGGVLL